MVLRTFEMSNFLLSHIFKMFHFYIKDFNFKKNIFKQGILINALFIKLNLLDLYVYQDFFFQEDYNDCVGQL